MIDTAMTTIARAAADFLRVRTAWEDPTDLVTLAPPTGESPDGGSHAQVVTLSLLNIEEEKINGARVNRVRGALGASQDYAPEPIHLSLLVLFAARFANYPESLRRISYVLECFQSNNVLLSTSAPDTDSYPQELILDLHTVSPSEAYQIWNMFGGNYTPSVIYRVRLVTIDAGRVGGAATAVANTQHSVLPKGA